MTRTAHHALVGRVRAIAITVGLVVSLLGAGLGALWLAGWRPVPSPIFPDLTAYLEPKYRYAAEQIATGHLPLWNPYEFCGLPFFATMQPAVLYPPLRALYAIFGTTQAYAAFFVVHLLLGAGFTSWLVLDMGARRWPAILASAWVIHPWLLVTVYNQAGFLSGLVWMPLLLLLTRRVAVAPTLRTAALIGAVAAIQATSGYPPLSLATGYFLLLALPFWIVEGRGDSEASLRSIAGALTVSVVVAALLAAAQLLPTMEFVTMTERTTAVSAMHESLAAAGEMSAALMRAVGAPQLTARAALEVAWEQFGPIPIVLGAAGLLAGPSVGVWYYLVASIVCTLVPMPVLRHLPFSGFVRWFLEWPVAAPFFVYAFAGCALDRIATRARVTERWQAVTALSIIVGIVAWNFPFAAPAWRTSNPWPDRMLPASVLEACDVGPGRSRIFWPEGNLNAAVVTQRIDSIAGYESSLYPARITRVLRALDIAIPPLWGGWQARVAEHFDLYARMGVRCIVVGQPAQRVGDRFRRIPNVAPGFEVYRAEDVLPRARAVDSIIEAETPAVALDLLLSGRVDPRSTVILEGEARSPLPCSPSDGRRGSAHIESYAPEEVRVGVDGPCEHYVVLADSYDPGWTARIDGVPSRIYVADYAFRAVLVSSGAHTLVFTYAPVGVRIGFGLSAAGLVLLAALVVLPGARDPLRPDRSRTR